MSDALLKAEIKGLKETQASLEAVVRALTGDEMLTGMRNAVLAVTRTAKQKAPVDTGRLRASITPEVQVSGATVTGIVGSNVKYAPFVELGTRGPRFVPAQYIGRWAKRHGFGDRGIVVSGKAKPFLKPAIEDNRERIHRYIGDAVATICAEDNP